MVYLDSAATSFPKPESVYRAVDSFLRSSGNPGRGGHALARRAEEAVEAVRLRVARFFHLPSPERVIFTLNATDALNMAIKGYLRPGDHVITTWLEHNSVARPLQSLSERGVRVTRVACDQQGLLDLEALDKAIAPTTRLVVLTWASNVVGTLQPVPEVARICRRHGVKLLVDAAQAAGHIPIDVQAVGVDMLAASGHKGLMGPPGTGLLLLAPDVDLAPYREGGTGVASHLATQPHFYPQRLESGTPNTAGIVGLGAGLQFLTEVGVDRVAEHEAQLTEALWEGLASVPSVVLYGPPGSRGRAALLSFNAEGWDPVELATVLDQSFGIACRAGLHCAPWAHQALGTFPTGTVRFSVGYFNTMQDVEQAVHAVKAIVASGRR